jgi:hypothetical protein
MFAIMTMNATDQILQERECGRIPKNWFDDFQRNICFSILRGLDTHVLIIVERIAWWLHIIGIFAFAIYVTYSKHLHTFMAFPNTYYSNLEPAGKIKNMPEVTNEVNMMLGITNSEVPVNRTGD